MSVPILSVTIESFLISKAASGRSPNTIRNYRKELSRFTEFVGDIEADKVPLRKIEEYLKYLRQDFNFSHCANTPIAPRKLSSKSVKNAWATLSAFWRWSSLEFEFTNPFRIQPVRANPKPVTPLSEEEVGKILKLCDSSQAVSRKQKVYKFNRGTAKRDKAIILTLLDTGIRVSELCGSLIKDYDVETGRIYVTGKGDKSRNVYLGKISKQAVWRYLIERFPNGKLNKLEPLFLSRDGLHKMSRGSVLELVKRLGNKAGIHLHPHKFRHTFAIQFLRNSGNVLELQELLGHTDLKMVKNYARVAEIDLENASRRASPVDNWRLR